MHLFCLIALLGLQALEATELEETWGYWGKYGPENWQGMCKVGKRQSPINIVTEDAIRIDLGALKFNRYDFAFSSTLINTGHSVEIRLNGVPIHLTGGCMSSTYVLEQMHFHWSAEHTVDDLRDPLELHLVHYNKKYTDISEAARYEDGIAVVAVLFELSNDANLDLSPIVDATKIVSHWMGQRIMLRMRSKVIPLLFLPKDHTTYYHYKGSLTTPECQESVLWFIMTEKLKVSEAQMDVFRQVDGSNGTLKFNYRPIQNLGNRKVYHRLEGYVNASSSISWTVYTVLSILLVRFLSDNF